MRGFARVALALGSAALALSLAEAALEVASGVREARRERRPTPHYTWGTYATDGRRLSARGGPLQLVLDPVVLYRNRPGQQGPWFTINSHGYRGPELRRAGSKTPRIVLLGGSAAFGTGLASDAETLAAALVSATGAMLAHVFPQLRRRLRALLDTTPAAAEATPRGGAARRAPLYARNVLAMAADCRARGVRFVVVLQPERDGAPGYRRFRELVMTRLRGEGVEPLDAARIAGLEAVHFVDQVHLTAEGTRLVARHVAARLRTPRSGR